MYQQIDVCRFWEHCTAPLVYPRSEIRSIEWDPGQMSFHLEDGVGTMQDLSEFVVGQVKAQDLDLQHPSNSINAIRHAHLSGYDEEWTWLREWYESGRVELTTWRVVVFAFLTETAVRILDWPWHNLSVGKINKEAKPATISHSAVLDWLRYETVRLGLADLFSDGLTIQDSYLNNVRQIRCYTRCERGHIWFSVDHEITNAIVGRSASSKCIQCP